MKIIAEIKTCSPFGFRSVKNWHELFDIALKIGDIIAIHTNLLWGGSFDMLQRARSYTTKPILAKGIHSQDWMIQKAVECGADYVLVVDRIPAVYTEKCLIEPSSISALRALPQETMAVWNSRNLTTGGFKKESFAQARSVFGGWLCQASNIKTIEDVNEDADAILVGSYLPEFANSVNCNV